MKTILICNQKGGVGKTLIADELAFSLERDLIPYSFYDLDNQGSAIHKTVNNPDAEVQVVDTPGALQENLLEWINEADFIIVPTMMSNRDTAPLERMINILEPFKDKKPVLYVLNKWNRFNQAGAYGISIFEYQKNGLGCRQIEAIYNTVKYELNLRERWRS